MSAKFIWGVGAALTVLGLAFLFNQLGQDNSSPVNAAGAAELNRTITVSGAASAGAKPDIVRATFGVETIQKTLEAALAENNQRMAAVIAKLKELGIADRDIQTVNFSVNVERAFNQGVPGPITGYRVTNNVRATIRSLDLVGMIIDRAIGAGANTVGSIAFGISEVKTLQSQARAQAVADAQAKAQELAKAAGIQVGQVITIVETGVTVPQGTERSAAPVALAAVPIEGGELIVSVSVQVVFAIQ
jgi:uncharacterized protein YggE